MVRPERLPRHAVDAPEVASIGQRDPQIPKWTSPGVEEGCHGAPSGLAMRPTMRVAVRPLQDLCSILSTMIQTTSEALSAASMT
jgi:hypothetical protein